MSDARGILWSIFWKGVHLGDWYTPQASEIATTFVCNVDIFDHRIDLC